MLDTSIETHTLRNTPSELALPMRKWDVSRSATVSAAPVRIERRHLALCPDEFRCAVIYGKLWQEPHP